MIGNVEDRNPGAAVILLAFKANRQAFHDQNIERKESGKTAGAVARTDEILLLIQS